MKMNTQEHEPERKLEDMLQALYEVETPGDFSARVMQRIAGESELKMSGNRSLQRRFVMFIGSVAACVALLVGASVFVRKTFNDEMQIAESSSDRASQSASVMDSQNAIPPNFNVLELPDSGSGAMVAVRVPKSDWLKDNFVAFVGALGNPRKKGGRHSVELKVNRIIKGDAGSGRIIATD